MARKVKCAKCQDRGQYYDPRDRDVYEGYKLAPLHFCGCKTGQKSEKTQHIHVNADHVVQIHDKNKVYEYCNGRIRKVA